MPNEVKEKLSKVLRWVEDPRWYDQFHLPPYRRYDIRMTLQDRLELDRVGKFMKTRPRCGVKAFCVPEWDKDRKRPIFWPDINKAISKDMLMKKFIPLKDDIRRSCSLSKWSVQFDFAAWYDQLPLHPDISKFFSVDGMYCLASLPMGFRPSAEVAHIITEAIASFPLPHGVSVIVYIDNIRFGGESKEAVEAAAKEFVSRAQQVGAILNSEEIVACEMEDFLGECYDLKNSTRSLTKKTLAKVHKSIEMLKSKESLTFRQVSAIVGLLFFTSDVLRLQISSYFEGLRYFRRTMACCNEWDAKAPMIPDIARSSLLLWLADSEANIVTPIHKDTSADPDLVIFTDASEIGWGALCVSKDNYELLHGNWSDADRLRFNVAQSTVAEPLAVRRAIIAAVSTSNKNVKIVSDHQGLVFAGNRKYGKGTDYNDMCNFINKFTFTQFSFEFIPGALNTVADRLSRARSSDYKS